MQTSKKGQERTRKEKKKEKKRKEKKERKKKRKKETCSYKSTSLLGGRQNEVTAESTESQYPLVTSETNWSTLH